MSALEKIGLKVSSSVGGYYIWAELPPNVDEIDLARSAAEKSIFIAPGTVFTTTRTLPTPAMRINIAYANDPKFIEFMQEYLNCHR
jgi:DNA-binding transcriptional MocR family regulator